MNAAQDPSVIPAAQARARAAKHHGAVDQVMLDLLPAAQALARPPVSNFAVGAVAQGLSGALYLGANLEFAGQPLSATVHAEQAAIASAWGHGETGVVTLAVTTPPCGLCRQFLNELVTAGRLRIILTDATPTTLAALLPAAFGPSDLGLPGGLMQPEHHGLTIAGDEQPSDPVVRAALQAADASYAPYSKAYAGVALGTEGGAVHAGRYAENAAFNPSLPALQAALVRVALTATPYHAITRAVLVEAPGPVSQRALTEALLAAVAPGVVLSYLQAAPRGGRAATTEESPGLDSTDTSALS